jgi:hypothetical protein
MFKGHSGHVWFTGDVDPTNYLARLLDLSSVWNAAKLFVRPSPPIILLCKSCQDLGAPRAHKSFAKILAG